MMPPDQAVELKDSLKVGQSAQLLGLLVVGGSWSNDEERILTTALIEFLAAKAKLKGVGVMGGDA